MHVYMCIHAHVGVGTHGGCECVHAYAHMCSVHAGMRDHTCRHRHGLHSPAEMPAPGKQACCLLLLHQLHSCTGRTLRKCTRPSRVLCHPRKAGPHRDVPERLSGEGVLLKHKQKTSATHLISPPGPPSHRARLNVPLS